MLAPPLSSGHTSRALPAERDACNPLWINPPVTSCTLTSSTELLHQEYDVGRSPNGPGLRTTVRTHSVDELKNSENNYEKNTCNSLDAIYTPGLWWIGSIPARVHCSLMSEEPCFADFVRRIRAGDEQAAGELVRQYEPIIRREVRLRLQDPRLYQVFDSMDICQSVLKSFFVRAAAGQYDLEEPTDLLKLLVVMTQHKLAFQVRKERAQRRDSRRVVASTAEELNVAAPGPSPSELVAGQELLQAFRERLSDEERRLADLRSQGCAWAEIAAQLGGTPPARRMQLTRAIERVALELRLDDVIHQ